MLEDLSNLTQSRWFEEGECSLQILEVCLEEDVLALSLTINDFNGENSQLWKVDCVGPLEHKVTLGGNFYEIGSFSDHVLLWPYLHPSASLSFFGESTDPLAVVGALYSAHKKAVGHWFCFDRFLNGDPFEMIRGRYGMLAEGPVPLLAAYAEVLEECGLRNGISEPRPAPYTNDSTVRIEEIGLLTLGHDSYVVASKFHAERLE